MKKIAFFVEGQTEQIFLNQLLIEIAGSKKIHIKLTKFKGKGKPTENIIPKNTSELEYPIKHAVLIYNCANDEGVKSRILDEFQDLFQDGYSEIIGLRDLFPLTNPEKLRDRLQNGLVVNNIRLQAPLPNNTSIIIAVREIEDWFIAETNHYLCIDNRLTKEFLKEKLDFELFQDDLILFLNNRNSSASNDLDSIYKLVKKFYTKDSKIVQRTVECLDYGNIYLNVSKKTPELNDLIGKINHFLT